jgi:hypothetical protein
MTGPQEALVSRRKRRRKADGHNPEPKARPTRGLGRIVVVTLVVLAAIVLVVTSWRSGSESRSPAASSTASPAAPSSSAPAAAAAADTPEAYRRLIGDWLRPDGGYVLSVRRVSPDGAAEVAYFNPRPIRVATATVRQEGGLLGLSVKFDDVNYPGSTYTLGYDAATDQLKGIYFQAVQQEKYEVVFVRRR